MGCSGIDPEHPEVPGGDVPALGASPVLHLARREEKWGNGDKDELRCALPPLGTFGTAAAPGAHWGGWVPEIAPPAHITHGCRGLGVPPGMWFGCAGCCGGALNPAVNQDPMHPDPIRAVARGEGAGSEVLCTPAAGSLPRKDQQQLWGWKWGLHLLLPPLLKRKKKTKGTPKCYGAAQRGCAKG